MVEKEGIVKNVAELIAEHERNRDLAKALIRSAAEPRLNLILETG